MSIAIVIIAIVSIAIVSIAIVSIAIVGIAMMSIAIVSIAIVSTAKLLHYDCVLLQAPPYHGYTHCGRTHYCKAAAAQQHVAGGHT